jgi:hypothetical protein
MVRLISYLISQEEPRRYQAKEVVCCPNLSHDTNFDTLFIIQETVAKFPCFSISLADTTMWAKFSKTVADKYREHGLSCQEQDIGTIGNGTWNVGYLFFYDKVDDGDNSEDDNSEDDNSEDDNSEEDCSEDDCIERGFTSALNAIKTCLVSDFENGVWTDENGLLWHELVGFGMNFDATNADEESRYFPDGCVPA